jgi:hypothetical protein
VAVAPGEGLAGSTEGGDAGAGDATAERDVAAPDAARAPLAVAVPDRSVITTVDLVVRVDDVDDAATRAAAVARDLDGYVQSESTFGSPGMPLPVEPYGDGTVLPPVDQGQAVVVLRVPTERADEAVDALAALGETVSRSRSTDDVTEQVVDVQSRIETQRAAIARLQELLASATTVSDVLAVETQLTTRVAELESLEARQQQLTDLAALATLTATFVPPEAVVEEGTGFTAGLRAGWRAFQRSVELGLTAMGALLPFALVAALLLVPLVVWLTLRTRRNRRRAAAAPPPGASAAAAPDGSPHEPAGDAPAELAPRS